MIKMYANNTRVDQMVWSY